MTDSKGDSNTSPAWQTPLKDLHLARVMFRELRVKILDWQKKEYDDQILGYFAAPDELKYEHPNFDLFDLKEDELPFPQDFSNEPDTIKQLKNFINALYLAEQAFEKCGDLNLTTASSYNPKLITEAYEACHLLLNLGADLEHNFRHEISYFASGLASLIKTTNKPSAPRTSFTSHDVGLTVGRALNHKKPTSNDQEGYDLLTYFGAVFPAYPSYIETLRVNIEKKASRNPEHTPNINKQKMKQLVEQGKKLSQTIASSNQNSLYFVFNLISLIRQMQSLFTEIYQEAGELNETLQSLGQEYLALLKYELLPALFRGVDKLEIQLSLKPGRLSKPLMERIKPWHEALMQTAKLVITFDETNEHLLKLEDTGFIALRLQPLQEKIEASEEALHLIDPALAALKACLANPRENTRAALEKHIENLIPYMLTTDKALLSRLYKHFHEEANWTDYLSDWYNYATFNTEEARNNPNAANREHTLNQLKQRWKQIKTDRTFTRERYQNHAKSIQDNAHRVLFPCTSKTHAFQVSEQEVLENAYLASDDMRYTTQGDDTYTQHPQNLDTRASWVLYRSYEEKLHQLKQAQTDCDHLLDALDNHNPWKANNALHFNPPYNPALLDSHVLHQPENIYFKIEDGVLKYEVLEPSNKPCTLYLMTLEDALDAGHRGYVWNTDQKQLSYIAENGEVQNKLAVINPALLELFLKIKKSKSGQTKNIQINKNFIHILSDHHPGIVHKGNIPLAELGCPLTTLTTPEALTPYLPHIFNEALERGHIHDAFKTNCIKWYSAIQPYLMGAGCDERITRLFSGSFTRSTLKDAPHVSLSEARTGWTSLKLTLEAQERKLREKCDAYKEQCKNKTFSLPQKIDNKLKHREFSLDTVQFMPSVDPVKRQIHSSKKTCFKIELAFTHLETYAPEALLREEDYPWFQQTYVGQLSQATASQIKEQLEQIKAYEALQIKRNEQILKSLDASSTLQTDETQDENDAFMYFGHTYEPVVMQENAPSKQGELQLKIKNDQLIYQFMHYGQQVRGEIPLNQIKPPLTTFDKNTVITKDTLTSILGIAYIQRKHQIDVNPDVLSPDEALDLHQWYINHPIKRALYELHAKKKPAFIAQPQKNDTPEDRSDYLIKHKRISKYLNELRRDVYIRFGHLNKSLIQELNPEFNALKLPYPEVGAQNWLTNLLQKLLEGKSIELVQALSMLNKPPKPDNLSILETPQQVLLLKRLMNVIYYLEHIALEIEQINEKNGQIPYVLHLVISFFYVQDITPLLQEIAKDPIFSATHADIIHKINSISSMLNNESKYYLEDTEKNKQATLHSVLNALKMLPVRLSSSKDDFEEQRPKLKQATQKSVHTIEKILEHYNSSWSYLLLLLDLPSIQHLLNDMRHDVEGLLEHSHKATTNNLGKLKKEYLAKIILEADKLESRLGLNPGVISKPLTEIVDEFYKGLITPLTPDVNQQIKLLCDDNLIKERLKAAEARKTNAKTKLAHYKKEAKTMQNLLDACDQAKPEQTYHLLWMKNSDPRTQSPNTIKSLHLKYDYIRYGNDIFFINDNHELLLLNPMQTELILLKMEQTNNPNKYNVFSSDIKLIGAHPHNPKQAAYDALNIMYQKTLPTLKASLNSSDMYLTSIQKAKHQNLRDCFVFDEKKSQLYHFDAEGKLNPQTGCKFLLRSIPDDEDKPENLKHKTSRPFPFKYKKQNEDGTEVEVKVNPLTIETKYPTLVQHKGKYYLYANADNTGWKYTELDAEIIAGMKLNFSHTKPLDIHKKYQAMYNDIAAKTGLIYPIHLKNLFKAIRFITKKKESSEGAEKLYLSEHAIHEYITSNSDFSLQKHKVSIKPGCCLISLKTIPTDFYELELPAGYGSYYAQVGNRTDVLYYIDTDTRSITPLPIPENKQGTSDIKKLQDTRKNKSFDPHDFETMTALTGHTSDASVMIDINNFKPSAQSFEKLQALAKRCKAYYNGMIRTSELAEATADEQLEQLNKLNAAQKEKNNSIKRTIYTDYFNHKARGLAQEKVKLQGYKLCLLTDKTTLKPDCLYIKIRDGAIDYRVINPAGKHRKSFVNLDQIGWPKDKPLESIDELITYLPAILRITSKKGDGHTRSYTLANEYQEKLTEALYSERDNSVERAIAYQNVTDTVDEALAVEHAEFNQERLNHYKQLTTIIQDAFASQNAPETIDEALALEQTNLNKKHLKQHYQRLTLIVKNSIASQIALNPQHAVNRKKASKAMNEALTVEHDKFNKNHLEQHYQRLDSIIKDGIASQKDTKAIHKALAVEQGKFNKEQKQHFQQLDSIIKNGLASQTGSEATDKALAKKKVAFNQEYLKHYQKLDAINKAVGNFRLYLKRSEVQSKRSLTCFEKEDTIKSKRDMLKLMDELASDQETPHPKDRVKAIQKYLGNPDVLDNLMAHHTYKATCFESLVQCVFNLLETVGLYTPEVVQHMEKLAKAVEPAPEVKAPKANNAFRFFSETAKEKLKSAMAKPKPKNTGPEV